MKRTVKTEREAGFKNGLLHGSPLPHSNPANDARLYAENIRKAEKSTLDEFSPPLIKAYWGGYLEGIKSRP